MATVNPFDLLIDDDNEDPSQLIAAAQVKVEKPKKAPVQAQPAKQSKFPTKPPPTAQAVREERSEGGRGVGRGGRGYGRGRGRGRGGSGGFNGDSNNNETSFGIGNGYSGGYRASDGGENEKASERRTYGAPRGGFRGGRRGDLSNGEVGEGGERPQRLYERHSGTGRGNEVKRDGAGRGNWGTPHEIAPETEELVVEDEKNVGTEKQSVEEDAADTNKDGPVNEPVEKEPEVKEMTLDQYEKICVEKRKAFLASKTEERKVEIDKEFGSMQQLSSKKENYENFIKLGSEKDKRKDVAEKEERSKKSVSINEFLKPVEGQRYYNPGGRGRGRGRGSRDGFGGGNSRDIAAPLIEDPGQFPSLGVK